MQRLARSFSTDRNIDIMLLLYYDMCVFLNRYELQGSNNNNGHFFRLQAAKLPNKILGGFWALKKGFEHSFGQMS